MPLHEWLTLVSCAGHLGLASLVVARGSWTALGRQLALLCLVFFAFNGADVAYRVSHSIGWAYLDNAAASALMPVVFHFMAIFVGKKRAFRWPLATSYGLFGLLSAACLGAFVSPPLRRFVLSPLWAALLLGLSAPVLVWITVLLAAHHRRALSLIERARTELVLAAFAVGTLGCATDLVADAGLPVERLGNLGSLASTLLLAFVAMRYGLLEERIPGLLGLGAVAIGVLQLGGFLTLFRLLGDHQAMLLLAMMTLTLALLPAMRAVASGYGRHRQRTEYLATLGRFAAQMAHDIRNPLAAIKGAAQLVDEERQRGNAAPEKFVRLILDQAERLERVITDYQRIGRIDAVREPLSLNTVVESVLGGQRVAAPSGVKIEAKLGEPPPCAIDRTLVTGALENLVRNGFEALEAGGTIMVSTERLVDRDGVWAAVSVQDNGKGMDPRVRDRVFEDFFTTKEKGSGLGLAFVRRVVEAHEGEIVLESEEGRGTTVQIKLPAA